MRVFHLRASNFYGGPERQLHQHTLNLRDSDVEITIGSFSEDGKEPEFLSTIRSDGIRTHLLEVNSAYDFRAIRLLRSYLSSNAVSILCTHDYRSHLIGLLATVNSKTKWLAFSRGWTQDSALVVVFSLMDRMIIRFADRIVAVSHGQKRKLVRCLVTPGKITVVHNAIASETIEHVQPADLRTKFNLPLQTFIVVSAGRFSREKGQIDLVRAAESALVGCANLRFILFGDGPDLESIRKEIEKLGLADRILCPGFEKNVLSHIMGSNLLVNPSLSEGLPNVVLEAMALNVPVVATNVGGVPEIIEDGINGLLVPPRNHTSMCRAILEVVNNRKLAVELTVAARRTIIERFTFLNQCRQLVSVYRSLEP
jgi:glycosyltransferase involved in cell wall biosynthesis